MPISLMQFDPQKTPFNLTDALSKGIQAYYTRSLANRTNTLLPEELKKAQLETKYFGPKTEAEIALQKAQGNYYNTQADVDKYKMDNKLYDTDFVQNMRYIKAYQDAQQRAAAEEMLRQQMATQNTNQPSQQSQMPSAGLPPLNRQQDQATLQWQLAQMMQNPNMQMPEVNIAPGGIPILDEKQNLSQSVAQALRDQPSWQQSSKLNQVPDMPVGSLPNLLSTMMQPGASSGFQRDQGLANASMGQPAPQQQPANAPLPPQQVPAQSAGTPGIPMNDYLQAYIDKQTGFTEQQYEKARMEKMRTDIAAMPYKSMTTPEKNQALAQARAFGYTGDEASDRLVHGASMRQLAAEKGYDPSKPDTWPLAIPAPTNSMLTQQERANVARAGYNAIQEQASEALAPYARKLGKDFSVKQVMQAVKNENPEQQGKALAAAFMQTEANSLLARSGGIQNIGIGLLKQMSDKSLSNLNVMKQTLSPEVYKIAQKEIARYGNLVNSAENKALFGASATAPQKAQPESSQDLDYSSMSEDDLYNITGGR